MGNTCVASGGTPYLNDITVANLTDINFSLDPNIQCQRSCNHKGWQISSGKIVSGCEPSERLSANSTAQFQVSARQASLVRPNDLVVYSNQSENVVINILWKAPTVTDHLMQDSMSKQKKKVFANFVEGNELISISVHSNGKQITIQNKR